MKNSIMLIACLLVANIFTKAQNIETLILKPGNEGKDTYVNSAYQHQNTSFGYSRALISCAYTFQGEYGIGRSYIQFDFSAIPPEAEILSAKLDLKFDIGNGFGFQTGDNASYLQRVTSGWDEETTTWNSQPALSEQNQVLLPSSTDPMQDYLDIDVTNLVKDMRTSGNNYGFALNMIGTETYRSMIFAAGDSPDSTLWPKLTITYQVCSPTLSSFTSDNSNDRLVAFFDSSLNAETWTWQFGDGQYSDLQNPTHEYNAYGTYRVCLTTSNDCSTDTYCSLLIVGPNAIQITPSNPINVFPNPSATGFTVESTLFEETTQAEIVDITGKIMRNAPAKLAGNKFFISPMNAGVYTLIIINGRHSIHTKLVAY